MAHKGKKIKVNEIFYDIEGEGQYQGYGTLFIRLTGCNLRCKWCDTKQAYTKGDLKSVNELLEIIKLSPYKYINITGGEPLNQKQEVLSLIKQVQKLKQSKIKGFDKIISVETNGAVSIKNVNADNISMDLKLPASGEHKKMLFSNLALLKPKDQLKLVISSKKDMDYAVEILQKHPVKCVIYAQPVFGAIKLDKIKAYIMNNKLKWKASIQLHKI
ncbi:MAG: radical SAM protein [bacterium]